MGEVSAGAEFRCEVQRKLRSEVAGLSANPCQSWSSNDSADTWPTARPTSWGSCIPRPSAFRKPQFYQDDKSPLGRGPCHRQPRTDELVKRRWSLAQVGEPGLIQEVQDSPVVSHDVLAWHEFFVGTIGASAALTGLLFAAISINLQQILKYPQLPGRAAATLGMLVSSLVASGFGLAPGQSARALGVEIGSVAAVAAVQAVWVSLARKSPGEPVSWQIEHLPRWRSRALHWWLVA